MTRFSTILTHYPIIQHKLLIIKELKHIDNYERSTIFKFMPLNKLVKNKTIIKLKKQMFFLGERFKQKRSNFLEIFPRIFSSFLTWRTRNIKLRDFILILAALIGIIAGTSALLLKTGVYKLRLLLLDERVFNLNNYLLLVYPAIGITLTVLLKKYIIRNNMPHSISTILYSISKQNSVVPSHKTFSSMLGAMLTAGFGGSIGLESPIISSGSAIGSLLGRSMRLNYKTVTLLLACGASGAIAAIYNTPIAALFFTFEVLLIDLSQFTLIPILVSSVSGAIITKIFSAEAILFDFTIIDEFEIQDIPFFAVFAIICGFVAYYFATVFIHIEKKFEAIKQSRHKILIGSLLLGLIIFLFPPLFGEGFAGIKTILSGNYKQIIANSLFYPYKHIEIIILSFLLFLVLLKVVATIVTIGAGGIGGIFAPSLFTGAIVGFLFAHIIN